MEALAPVAVLNGCIPDAWVASNDLLAVNRHALWMALKNVIDLGIMNISNCIKVNDSVPLIYEGLNEGMWTVGISLSGNEAGFTLDSFLKASKVEKSNARGYVTIKMRNTNAHYFIDTIATLIAVINNRIV